MRKVTWCHCVLNCDWCPSPCSKVEYCKGRFWFNIADNLFLFTRVFAVTFIALRMCGGSGSTIYPVFEDDACVKLLHPATRPSFADDVLTCGIDDVLFALNSLSLRINVFGLQRTMGDAWFPAQVPPADVICDKVSLSVSTFFPSSFFVSSSVSVLGTSQLFIETFDVSPPFVSVRVFVEIRVVSVTSLPPSFRSWSVLSISLLVTYVVRTVDVINTAVIIVTTMTKIVLLIQNPFSVPDSEKKKKKDTVEVQWLEHL